MLLYILYGLYVALYLYLMHFVWGFWPVKMILSLQYQFLGSIRLRMSKASKGEQLSREAYKSIGPYSTKTLHKNKQDVSYISIGDPYGMRKKDKNLRWSRFHLDRINPTKGPITNPNIYSRVHTHTYTHMCSPPSHPSATSRLNHNVIS